jgi:long-chain acyl-CoA synthetase
MTQSVAGSHRGLEKELIGAQAGLPDLRTIPAMILENAHQRGGAPAVTWTVGTDTHTLSWTAYRHRILNVARALVDMGVGPDRDVAIILGNTVEHLVADIAAIHCGAATIGVYRTFSDEQIHHVLADAAPAVVIVQDDDTAKRIAEMTWAVPDPFQVVAVSSAGGVLDWNQLEAAGERAGAATIAELDRRLAAIDVNRPLTYIYTSGTTGPPKGVTLTTSNIVRATEALVGCGWLDHDYRSVSYLPLAHIVERLFSLYVPVHVGGHVVCCPNSADLTSMLVRFRPTAFFGVPRIFEKLRTGIESMLASPAMAELRPQIAEERRVLAEASRLRRADQLVPAHLHSAEVLARQGAVRQVRARMGLDKVSSFACGAAATTEDLIEFWASIGIEVYLGYGMTENSGIVTCDRAGSGAAGSVGLPLPGWEISIAGDGEILLRGPGNTPGYRNRAEATAELFTSDNWLRTGDIGHLDAAGRLHITGRKKDLLVTAAGKNIAPGTIESQLVGRSFIDQVMVFGEAKPYLVALIAVDAPALAGFAAAHGITDAEDPSALVEHPKVQAEVERLVTQANASLSRPEQIKKFAVLPDPWTPLSGELTATLKLRRNVVSTRFSEIIDGLYADARHP